MYINLETKELDDKKLVNTIYMDQGSHNTELELTSLCNVFNKRTTAL